MQVFCLRIANKTIETILVRTPYWPYYIYMDIYIYKCVYKLKY